MARIFISYSRADRQFIDQFIPLIRRVYGNDSVWFDDDIHGGVDWWQMILNEIEKCDIFVYLISNESLESPYCQAELREALRLKKQILPVIVRRLNPAYPGNIEDDLAVVLRRTQYVDMSGGFRDANTIASLYAALTRLLNAIPQQPLNPIILTPTPQPPVPDKPQRKNSAIIYAAIASVVLILIGGLIALNSVGNTDAPTLTDDETSVALVDTETPADEPTPTETLTLSPTDEPTNTPTATSTDEPTETPTDTQTPDIIAAAQLLLQQQTAEAIIAETTATAARATLDYELQMTEHANLTANATLWTAAPTNTTTTTATATPTPTRTPTATATSTPDPLQAAFVPIIRNADWTPIERDFNGVVMVLVPAGCFMMGSTQQQVNEQISAGINRERAERQLPQHEQCFDEPFWIDKYEVTQTQFRRLGGTQANRPGFSGDNRPVERMMWFEARNFCALRGSRLPTEAQWEYAARGPDSLVYPWGNTWNANYAVWRRNETANVGSIPAGISWVGALDMSGNVWEWTSSLFESYPYDAADGREADTDFTGGVPRVLRGGSWDHYGSDLLRAPFRFRGTPRDNSYTNGFRCARSYE